MNLIARVKLSKEETQYDHQKLLLELSKVFLNIVVQDGDQLAKRAENAQEFNFSVRDDIKRIIVDTLKLNAKLYGPAIAFEIQTDTGLVSGRIRPRDITFIFPTELSRDSQEKIFEYCRDQRGDFEILS